MILDNMKWSRHRQFAFALLLLAAAPAFAATSYTKKVEIAALRVSYVDLQNILAKAASLMEAANGTTEVGREKVTLKGDNHSIEISGHRFLSNEFRLPDRTDVFYYDASPWPPETQAITQISLYFTSNLRSLTVSGESPDQVDAIFSALRDDLNKLSTVVGGTLFGFVCTIAIFTLSVIAAVELNEWWRTRKQKDGKWAITCGAAVAAILVATSSGAFTGFSAVHGDASFVVRYGPQFGFWSFVIAAFAPWISMWRKEKQHGRLG